MRPVLIITPFFAPQSHAAVFRAHKLAKYLPQHGWKPIVLTVDTNYLYNEDHGLLAELPSEVEIFRSRYIEPSVRGARMALGGRPRTFAAMKSEIMREATPKEDSAEASGRMLGVSRRTVGHGYGLVREHLLESPDVYWPWVRPATSLGIELITRHRIELIYSTALPYSAHRIARALQVRTGAKWVADFRDPAGYGRKFTSRVERVRRTQLQLVESTLRHADAVSVLSSSYPLIFTDMFGEITRRPITFIPTGIDEALMPYQAHAAVDPYIVYVGEVMPDQTTEFFRVVASAFRQEIRHHRLVVVGHELMNRQRLMPLLKAEGITDRVQFVDHSPQAEVYRLIEGSRAGVLVPGRTSYWWTNHAKLVDYVGLRKPVIALVPDPSEARSVLNRTGLGVFLDGNDDEATRTLVHFLNGDLAPTVVHGVECDRYLSGAQVSAFAHLFSDLTEPGMKP